MTHDHAQPTTVQPVLSGSGLGHRFGARVLFRRMEFELHAGTATAVTGPNGSGKSTLLKIMAGLLRPTAGTVVLRNDGTDVPLEDRPLSCGFVAPYLNVYHGFTARENLQFIARARRMREAEARTNARTNAEARIDDVLADVGLTDRADDPVATYSSGMLQRVRLACALLPSSPVLLLDEPGSTLDEEGIAVVHRVVRQATDSGRIVVLATNLASEAALCSGQLEVASQG